MSEPRHPGRDPLPLDFYTRYGELDLEGRLLIRCDQQLAAGDLNEAWMALRQLLPRAPWLQTLCSDRWQQVLHGRRQHGASAERRLQAAIETESAQAVLERVLEQPSLEVVLLGCTPDLLLEGLLQQAVWDALVWLDPDAVQGDLPRAACWLDGFSRDRRPAPLRDLRLRGAQQHLADQGLAWVPRSQPLAPWTQAQQEAAEPADWPRCLQRSLARRFSQARQPLPAPNTASAEDSTAATVSLVLTIREDDSAEAIRGSLTSLLAAWSADGNGLAPAELVVAHPPLRPAQQAGLETAISALAAEAQARLQRIELVKRSGLALACNRALATCSADQLLVLRCGVLLEPGVISALQHALRDPQCRAAQPGLRSTEGQVVGLGYGIATAGQPGQALLHGQPWPATLPASSDQQTVLGSCWLLRRQELLAVGGWDPQYRDGLEDQDLCLRLIRHFGGHSTVCGQTIAVAPLAHGRLESSNDRDWNRCVFQDRWGSTLTADLAELAGRYGQELLGALPEPEAPANPSLRCTIGVLAPQSVS